MRLPSGRESEHFEDVKINYIATDGRGETRTKTKKQQPATEIYGLFLFVFLRVHPWCKQLENSVLPNDESPAKSAGLAKLTRIAPRRNRYGGPMSLERTSMTMMPSGVKPKSLTTSDGSCARSPAVGLTARSGP